MRVILPFLAASTGSRVFLRKGTEDPCQGMVGIFEGTTRVSVINSRVYLAGLNAPHHSEGAVTSASPCSCSGVLNHTTGEEWMFRFDRWTCNLEWRQEETGTELVNAWSKDGTCRADPKCDPALNQELLREIDLTKATRLANQTSVQLVATEALVKQMQNASTAFSKALPASKAALRTTKQMAAASRTLAEDRQALAAARAPPAAPPTTTAAAPRPGACAGLAGMFEAQAAMIDLHEGGVYITSGGKAPARGEAMIDTECECSGEADFGDLGEFTFNYDPVTCKLAWHHLPSLDNPFRKAANEWTKDGHCPSSPSCLATTTAAPAPAATPSALALSLAARTAATHTAAALRLIALAGADLSAEATGKLAAHSATAAPGAAAAAEAAGVAKAAQGPAAGIYKVLKELSPRDAEVARV
mmetsp:Transcript_120054/g.275041  ORF Transcript_120054/g.275041 Transcript_120054/m.275041 type:complete len:416 (-) Transcript_120054:38-1285(-)